MEHVQRRRAVIGLAAATAAATALTITPATADTSNKNDTSSLSVTQGYRKAVTLSRIQQHLAAFQQFADEGGTANRVAGSPANAASVAYVAQMAEAAGLDVTLEPFEFDYNADVTQPILQQISPNPTTYVEPDDFSSMSYSPNGDVTAPVSAPAGSPLGCEAGDFAGFAAGNIALVRRGSCTFALKATNAAAAGASAVVIANNGPGQLNGTLGGVQGHNAPVLGTTQALGDEWFALLGSGLVGRVKVDRVFERRTVNNVLAETPGGDPEQMIVVGAHIDSVVRGPGINDNGSGSAAILAMAEALEGRDIENKVQFAWWNAEEFSLLGSEAHVDGLSQAEIDNIALNLNFDMIGSPNYVRFVYDGDNSAFPVGAGSADGPDGSGLIEQVFHDYFGGVGLPSAETPFSGRSDYGPFIAVGIPAGGLFTGAEGVKTPAQEQVFGGTAGVSYDPCYHVACDTLANPSPTALDQMSDAAAHTLLTFARWDFDKAPLTDPEGPIQPHNELAPAGGGGGLHPEHEDEVAS